MFVELTLPKRSWEYLVGNGKISASAQVCVRDGQNSLSPKFGFKRQFERCDMVAEYTSMCIPLVN